MFLKATGRKALLEGKSFEETGEYSQLDVRPLVRPTGLKKTCKGYLFSNVLPANNRIVPCQSIAATKIAVSIGLYYHVRIPLRHDRPSIRKAVRT